MKFVGVYVIHPLHLFFPICPFRLNRLQLFGQIEDSWMWDPSNIACPHLKNNSFSFCWGFEYSFEVISPTSIQLFYYFISPLSVLNFSNISEQLNLFAKKRVQVV